MTRRRVRHPLVLAVAAVAGVVVLVAVALLVVEVRRSERLQPSATCEEGPEALGDLRFRSPPPEHERAAPADRAGGAGDARPAFRVSTAEPIYCADFADPFVLRSGAAIGSRLFVYATNTPDALVPVLASGSVLRGEEVGDALQALPAWAEPGAVWAPAVLARPDGTLVMYYTTTHRESGRQCISVAVGDDPMGPFVDRSSAPLICPIDLGGAIDPSPFVADDDTVHLLWKNDGNCCGVPSRIWSQPLVDDGTSVAGPAVELIGADQPWEGGVVEAPSMVRDDDVHLLFYSANAWDSADYAIGYARCDGPAGPCTKPDDQPWLSSSEDAAGPGGQELFTGPDGGLQMVFHAWPDEVGYESGGRRSLFTVAVEVHKGQPRPA